MQDKDLIWEVRSERPICKTPVFTVFEQEEVPPEDSDCAPGRYVAVDAPDWVIVLPVIEDSFVMVRQWRHGGQRVTIEFPAGLCEPNEEPVRAAERELAEETGCIAGRMKHLATVSSNPALFRNHVHFFLAEDLNPTGRQNTDSDEILTYLTVPIEKVIADFGSTESTHAFTRTALMLYMREMMARQK